MYILIELFSVYLNTRFCRKVLCSIKIHVKYALAFLPIIHSFISLLTSVWFIDELNLYTILHNLFIKDLLSAYYILGTVLIVADKGINKTKIFTFLGAYILSGERQQYVYCKLFLQRARQ